MESSSKKTIESPGVLVLGSGRTASLAAEGLSSRGFEVERPPEEGILAAAGTLGGFEPVFQGDGPPSAVRSPRAVLACDPLMEADFRSLGLIPSDRVMGMSSFLEGPAQGEVRGSVLFLLGVLRESRPAEARRVLEAALRLSGDQGPRVTILAGNLKVAGAGLEALAREARGKGVIIAGFTGPGPVLRSKDGGALSVEWTDEASRRTMRMEPDLLVLDEALKPGPRSGDLARILSLDHGPDRFPPSDNVHRLGIATNRRGLEVFHTEGDPLGREVPEEALDSLALGLRADDIEGAAPGWRAEIDPAKCARCLTCVRACPHCAVAVGERIRVEAAACFGCGVCEAACPGRAISMKTAGDPGSGGAPPVREIQQMGPGTLVVFGCRRGAGRARELARHLGLEVPAGHVFVPLECAGLVSIQALMDAFLAGAGGVMVMACHPGNCRSEKGDEFARRRVEEAGKLMAEAGMEAERLRFHTLAANSGADFARSIRGFHRFIRDLSAGMEDAKENQ